MSLVRLGSGSGIYAILPSAIALDFPAYVEPEKPFELIGKCAVVDVCGALTHALPMLQSYASILERVKAAAASDADAVVLRIASPGGDVYGAFDCARTVARIVKASGKRLIAFSEAQACSSAYALASVADEIVISDTAMVGSIGVIATVIDVTKADATAGLNFGIVTSGKRKADGNPHAAFSKETLAALRVSVDATAEVFFDLVAQHRDLSVDEVREFEATTFVGAAAVEGGLADRVGTWEELVSDSLSGSEPAREESQRAPREWPVDRPHPSDARLANRARLTVMPPSAVAGRRLRLTGLSSAGRLRLRGLSSA